MVWGDVDNVGGIFEYFNIGWDGMEIFFAGGWIYDYGVLRGGNAAVYTSELCASEAAYGAPMERTSIVPHRDGRRAGEHRILSSKVAIPPNCSHWKGFLLKVGSHDPGSISWGDGLLLTADVFEKEPVGWEFEWRLKEC